MTDWRVAGRAVIDVAETAAALALAYLFIEWTSLRYATTILIAFCLLFGWYWVRGRL